MDKQIRKVMTKLDEAIDNNTFDIAIQLTKLLQELLKAEKSSSEVVSYAK